MQNTQELLLVLVHCLDGPQLLVQPFCPSESCLTVTFPPPSKTNSLFGTHMKTGFEENALRLKTEDWQQENVNLIN